MENLDQLESGELPLEQPSLQNQKDQASHSRSTCQSRTSDRHGGRLSSGLSYVPRPRELDWRRDDHYDGRRRGSSRDDCYRPAERRSMRDGYEEWRESSRDDYYGRRQELSRDDYYERRRESSRDDDDYKRRRESSRDNDYYENRRGLRPDVSREDRREPRLASTSSPPTPTLATSNAAAAAAAAAAALPTTTATVSPPTRGMTGTNLVPLAVRGAPRTDNEHDKAELTKATTATINPKTGEKPVSQPNSGQLAGKKMQRLQSYINGPPDPPADLVVWTGVSARLQRIMDKTTYTAAFGLVWEKGGYLNRTKSFEGQNMTNAYAEFAAAYEALLVSSKKKTLLIKTTSAEVINAIQNNVDSSFSNEIVTLRNAIRREVRGRPGVFFKKVPSRCGLANNDLACSMAEEARKDLEETKLGVTAQFSNETTDTVASNMERAEAFLQKISEESWAPPSKPQVTRQQQQAPTSQNQASGSGQSLESVLRQRALVSMQGGNAASSSSSSSSPLSSIAVTSSLASVKTVRPFAAPRIASLSGNQQQEVVDEDGRLAKARKTSLSDTATAHQDRQQPGTTTRDPRLRRKEPVQQQQAPGSTNGVVPPQDVQANKQPQQQQQQQPRVHHQPRMVTRHLQMVQNIIRPTPETRNTVKNRDLAMERSNDRQAVPPPTPSSANNIVTAQKQDEESDEEFFDALDYWVGQHREDLKGDKEGGSDNDNDGEGKADPSSTLSWISDLL